VCACKSGVRAAEEAEEYLSALVGYEMRYAPWIVYNHRAPAPDPPSLLCAPQSGPSACHKLRVFGAVGRPRLTYHCKLLRFSTLAITVYNTYHMEWVFTL
jgi:hypothetical protein